MLLMPSICCADERTGANMHEFVVVGGGNLLVRLQIVSQDTDSKIYDNDQLSFEFAKWLSSHRLICIQIYA